MGLLDNRILVVDSEFAVILLGFFHSFVHGIFFSFFRWLVGNSGIRVGSCSNEIWFWTKDFDLQRFFRL